jgi:cytochrome c biogenesis protein CcmG, thiol:disulfide interchange protein DsbE
MDELNSPARDMQPERLSGDHAARRRWQKRRIVGMGLVSLMCLGLVALLGTQLLTPAPKQAAAADPLIGHLAPDFTLAVLSATPGAGSPTFIHLAKTFGKPIVLNFWASWCDPCKHEAPLLEATWHVISRQGIVLIGIDFQDTQMDGQQFLQTYGITYPNVMDNTGSAANSYNVLGLPETFFLNRKGILVSRVTGELTEQTLQDNLRLLT